MQLNELRCHILPFAQADDINEVRNGLRVIHGSAPGNDQRSQARAVCAVQGNIRQVQHI